MADPDLARFRVRAIVGGAPVFCVLFLALVAASPTHVRPLPAVLVVAGLIALAAAVGIRHRVAGPFVRGPAYWYGTAFFVVVAGVVIAALGPGPATAFSVSQSFIALAIVVIAIEGRARLLAAIGHGAAWLLTQWLLNDPSTDALVTGVIFQTGAITLILLAGQLFSGHVFLAATANESARSARAEAELGRVEERQRLAEALHDHALQLVVAAVQDLEEAPPGEPAVTAARARIADALKALRGLTVTMHADRLTTVEPRVALQYVVAEVTGDGRLDVTLEVDAGVDRRHTAVLVESLRELLQNVRRHAGASRATVVVTEPAAGRTRLTVEDDGTGVDEAAVERAIAEGHVGVWRLRRHAELRGGRFVLQRRPEGGTRAEMELGEPRT